MDRFVAVACYYPFNYDYEIDMSPVTVWVTGMGGSVKEFDLSLSYDGVIWLPNGLFYFLSVEGDGRKIPGLVKSMNFRRSTAKSPKIPGGWKHFTTKFIEIEIFTLTDFSRQSCHCKQEFQGKKGKKYFPGG